MKKTIYVDLDNTLADYLGMCDEMHISPVEAKHTIGFFRKLKPMPGALEAYAKLKEHFNLYIFFLENKPDDTIPVWKLRRMNLYMFAGKFLCAVFLGIINQIVTHIQILVVAEYDVLICRRQVFLYPFHLLAQRMRIAPGTG